MSLRDVQTPESELRDLEWPVPESAIREPRTGWGRRTGWGKRRRKPLLIALAGALLLGGGVAATLVGMTKSVIITVDGQTRRISTLADSVTGALQSAGLTVTDHDVVAPAVDASIADGSAISLNRGRLLTVTIDGSTREVWTTALTVEDALAEIGQDTQRLSISADRNREIPVAGFALTAATLHTVALTDGATGPVSSITAARTVADLLAEQHITLGARDSVTPEPTTVLVDGASIAITRTVVTTTVQNEAIAQPADVSTDDPNLDRGKTAVTVPGSPGTAAVSYEITTVNGELTSKVEVGREVTVAPVATQIATGTKTTLTWVGEQVFFNDTEFGINWDALALCESTHNPKAINANPTAGLPTYGLFQFDLPTWASVGGTGNPIDATPEEQIMRAKLLYQSRGLQPWACGYAAR